MKGRTIFLIFEFDYFLSWKDEGLGRLFRDKLFFFTIPETQLLQVLTERYFGGLFDFSAEQTILRRVYFSGTALLMVRAENLQ